MSDWRFFYGNGEQHEGVEELLKKLAPPPWRRFGNKEDANLEKEQERWQKLKELAASQERSKKRGENFRIYSEEKTSTDVINAVNAAIYLRRPLLVTGKPGAGKTSLAYAISHELQLGPVLSWAITARSTLQEGLYSYDALARLQDSQQNEAQDIGKYITLGALGTAFLPSSLPRVLLIDEIDKSDINLPNDLLNLLEEGEFEIPELVRRSQSETEEFKVRTQDKGIDALIKAGRVGCYAFPIIVMTSNGERDFPPAFKRRCLRVRMPEPKREALKAIVEAHFAEEEELFQQAESKINQLINEFMPDEKQSLERATDQLLNTIYLLTREVNFEDKDEKSIKEILFKTLDSGD